MQGRDPRHQREKRQSACKNHTLYSDDMAAALCRWGLCRNNSVRFISPLELIWQVCSWGVSRQIALAFAELDRVRPEMLGLLTSI